MPLAVSPPPALSPHWCGISPFPTRFTNRQLEFHFSNCGNSEFLVESLRFHFRRGRTEREKAFLVLYTAAVEGGREGENANNSRGRSLPSPLSPLSPCDDGVPKFTTGGKTEARAGGDKTGVRNATRINKSAKYRRRQRRPPMLLIAWVREGATKN